MGSRPVTIVLLDTHVWIWVVNGGPERLSADAREVIEAAALDSALAVSAISAWEVAMLEAKGRLQLQMDCRDWVTTSTRRAGLRVVPLLAEIAVSSTRLPGEFHGDPADRIIAATARHEGAVIVTRDHSLLAYAQSGFLRAIRA